MFLMPPYGASSIHRPGPVCLPVPPGTRELTKKLNIAPVQGRDFRQKNKATHVSDGPPLTIHQERRYLSA